MANAEANKHDQLRTPTPDSSCRFSADLEKETQNQQEGLNQKSDPQLVSWSGSNDPENPKNWPTGKKWGATLIISAFTFISTVTSSMAAPALSKISEDLDMNSEIEANITLSIFILAFAVGPLFLGPLSEIYGRVRVLQISNLFFLAFNMGCAFARNEAELIAFRFLSGIGGSAQMAGGGVLSDCFTPSQRSLAVAVFSLAPTLGPALGPVAGGFVVEKTTWRWVFWSTSIVDCLVQLLGLYFFSETYEPVLLSSKAKKLAKETGNPHLRAVTDRGEGLVEKLKLSLIRPSRMLTTQPIVMLIAVYMAYLFGLMYLLLCTFPMVYKGVYKETTGIAALNYITLGISFVLGGAITVPSNNAIYRRLTAKSHGTSLPEYRIPMMLPGSILIPAGLLWYGWSAEKHLHWIMPNLGIVVFGIGSCICMQCMQAYTLDAYQTYTASAMAAAAVLRSVAGFGFPIFAPDLYATLGLGWGTSVLALMGLVVGVPAVGVFWFYGEKLRGLSRYAAG